MRKILSNRWLRNPFCVAVAILMFDAAPRVFGSIPVMKIDSDITTNQVWNNKTAYYIMKDIGLKALLVIEPGTTVINGPNGGLFVSHGGTLIAEGTPDKPVIFTFDDLYFNFPKEVGYYWQRLASKVSHGPYSYCPIVVTPTASIATTIRYCMIEGADTGILIMDIRLKHPIENNYLCGNNTGICEIGPRLTDIRNNLCFYNDAGIAIWLQNVEDLPDPDFTLKIENNTCDSGRSNGIGIQGVSKPDKAPGVALINNIVSNYDQYGLNLVGEFKRLTIRNTGYYGNRANINIEYMFDEENPIKTDQYPFTPVAGSNAFPGGPWAHHYLKPDCPFVDAGDELVENTPYKGMSTNANGSPDKDKVDLGFHRIDWKRKSTSDRQP
ncbi:MAG: right-handed parallel beta-helix repeat-containing protein [Phycisphaerae bacterium]|nr:right-handed parallel beta-helix repeat-containing protein [Phycisphaerae bacterium]